jgi:hypothetical protein
MKYIREQADTAYLLEYPAGSDRWDIVVPSQL